LFFVRIQRRAMPTFMAEMAKSKDPRCLRVWASCLNSPIYLLILTVENRCQSVRCCSLLFSS
jgi:hypothetical protein